MTAPYRTAPCASHELFVGALVDWLHTPRGGYGFSVRIPAKVLRLNLTGDRVVIEAATRNGAKVTRTVSNTALRWRQGIRLNPRS